MKIGKATFYVFPHKIIKQKILMESKTVLETPSDAEKLVLL